MPDEEYITVAQACRAFRAVHDARFAGYCETGVVQGIKPGHDWLVKPSAVMEYLRQERKPGRKPRHRSKDIDNYCQMWHIIACCICEPVEFRP